MAHWGIAFALGPNYNKPCALFDPADQARVLARAQSELALASALSTKLSAIERALIEALHFRYPDTLQA